MNIFRDLSAYTVLSLAENSTDHRFYAAELCDITGYSKRTIYGILTAAKRAGFLVAQEEPWGTYTGRAARIYYEPTQYFLDICRATPLSSL